jgi:hypothetical protein
VRHWTISVFLTSVSRQNLVGSQMRFDLGLELKGIESEYAGSDPGSLKPIRIEPDRSTTLGY